MRKWKITPLYRGLFLLFALSLRIILKIRREISRYARKHEIRSREFTFCIDYILILDPHIRTEQMFRINEVSEFLLPLKIPERFQNLWYPERFQRGFRISDTPKDPKRGFRISDTRKDSREVSEFLIPLKDHREVSEFLIPLKLQRGFIIYAVRVEFSESVNLRISDRIRKFLNFSLVCKMTGQRRLPLVAEVILAFKIELVTSTIVTALQALSFDQND